MSRWIQVIKAAEFTTDRHVMDYDGEQIVIFKLADGFYAILDECSHDDAPLSEGEVVEGCRIECPRHGALFDIRNGDVLGFPAVEPVKAFPVKVENGMVMVQVDG